MRPDCGGVTKLERKILMLAPTELRKYQQRLQNLANRLDEDCSQLKDEALRPDGGEASGGLSDVPVHPADLGTHTFEEEVSLGLLSNEEQLLQEIEDALSRIDQGNYGTCAGCCQRIPKTRLDAIPYARFCVACTKAREA